MNFGKVYLVSKKLIMKYILILLIFGCTTPKYVVQESRFELKNGKVKIIPVGQARPLNDTVMNIIVIRKK